MKTLPESLAEMAALFQEAGEVPADYRAQAQALGARLGEGQLHLAVLGQFKRGKSTVINALLGEAVLPDGVLPVTAVPVFLYAAPDPKLHVYTEDRAEPLECPLSALSDYVTESGNPQNQKRVASVHLFFPAALLQTGTVLIDTPGIGSTNESNTETTLRFLPQCDAAIVVFSTDPPITAAEVDFLKTLQPHVAHFFYVLNKVDYLRGDEVATAMAFLRDVLREALGEEEPLVFAVSARQGLAARQSGDEGGWQASGMAAFADHLRAFASGQRRHVLPRPCGRRGWICSTTPPSSLLCAAKRCGCRSPSWRRRLEPSTRMRLPPAASGMMLATACSAMKGGCVPRLRPQRRRCASGLKRSWPNSWQR
jgi:hypothetical protein